MECQHFHVLQPLHLLENVRSLKPIISLDPQGNWLLLVLQACGLSILHWFVSAGFIRFKNNLIFSHIQYLLDHF